MGDFIMIKKFKVSNYKGFKEELEFNLESRDYNYNKSQVKNGIVKNCLIYGKNGVGKSNLGLALFDITHHLSDKQKTHASFNSIFLNLENEKEEATFEYSFLIDKKEIKYKYTKSSIFELRKEELSVCGEEILYYDYKDKNSFRQKLNDIDNLRIDLLGNNISILKYIYKNTPQNSNPILHKLMSFVDNMLWFRCLSDGNNYMGFTLLETTMDDIIIRNNKLLDFEKFLRSNEIDYKLSYKLNINNTGQIVVDYPNGKQAPLSLIASSGTKSLWLWFAWSLYFEEVSFLFIDDFDAYYHYKISGNIIKTINDIETQTLVTTHSTYLMKNDLTRPDCCFILSENKINSLSNCTEKEIRQAHNLEKMYHNGSFNE